MTLAEDVRVAELIAWNAALWNPLNEVEIVLDFKNTRFFTPFAMMFIIQQIDHYRSVFPAARVLMENHWHLTWPQQMGMFAVIDENRASVTSDTKLNYTTSNAAYIPITSIDTSEFLRQSGRSLSAMNEAVDRMAEHQAKVLTQLGSGYAFDVIQYSLREIMRNVFEHSGSKILRFCAQYWPSTRHAELTVADMGMGVFQSLVGNPAFKKLAERDSLHFACLPGVSGNAEAMKERSTGNPWRNSGYGLYMTSRLCRNDGDFLIVSSERALYLNQQGKRNFRASNVKGTIIRMHLRLGESQTLRSKLQQYTTEGKAISETIKGAKVLEASAASQMLRRDFAKI